MTPGGDPSGTRLRRLPSPFARTGISVPFQVTARTPAGAHTVSGAGPSVSPVRSRSAPCITAVRTSSGPCSRIGPPGVAKAPDEAMFCSQNRCAVDSSASSSSKGCVAPPPLILTSVRPLCV